MNQCQYFKMDKMKYQNTCKDTNILSQNTTRSRYIIQTRNTNGKQNTRNVKTWSNINISKWIKWNIKILVRIQISYRKIQLVVDISYKKRNTNCKRNTRNVKTCNSINIWKWMKWNTKMLLRISISLEEKQHNSWNSATPIEKLMIRKPH